MRNIYNTYTRFIISFLLLGVLACGGANGENTTAAVNKIQGKQNSPFYTQIVLSNQGEFAGLELGDSRTEVKNKLPQEAFDNESANYMYYKWEVGTHEYNLELFFDDNDQLSSIDGYVRFYDKEGAYDQKQAEEFYSDIKKDFVNKYGNAEEISLDDFRYLRWIFDLKDAEVGIDNAEVYWYIYSYKEDR